MRLFILCWFSSWPLRPSNLSFVLAFDLGQRRLRAAGAAETALFLGEDWFDPLEAAVRTRIRSFIEELLEAELDAALGRKRYARGRTPEKRPSAEAARSLVLGHRHGHRERTL